jgi:hypothetical protein
MFSDHKEIKLDINNKRMLRKFISMWKLTNNQRAKHETKEEIIKYL